MDDGCGIQIPQAREDFDGPTRRFVRDVKGLFVGPYASSLHCTGSDPSCVKLVVVYSRQVPNRSSVISGNDKSQTVACLFMRSLDAIYAKKHANIWCAPPVLHPVQFFTQHILHYVLFYYEDYSLARVLKSVPQHNWSPSWRSIFNKMDIKVLLSVDLTALGLEPWTSTVPSGGKRIFTTKNIWRNQLVVSYYGTLCYYTMSISHSSGAVNGEGMLAVKSIAFSKWALETKWKAFSRFPSDTDGGVEYTIWIFPVPLCTVRFINDACYGPDEAHSTDVRRTANPGNYRHNNVQFRYFDKTANSVDFWVCNVVQVIATEGISAGSQLFLSYGGKYMELLYTCR